MSAAAAVATVVGADDTRPQQLGKKSDVWLAWYVVPIFYMAFGIIFFPLTRVMPPPRPGATPEQAVAFFTDNRLTIQIGFGMLMVIIGFAGIVNGLVAYQMKRMSVGSVFAYAYIASLAVGGVPGCLLAAFAFLTATYRTDRDPQVVLMLYDLGLLSFVGSLGCFLTQYIVLAIAILWDKNKIFPKWIAYVSIWQVVTEIIAGPVFIFKEGPFAWNGSISFWLGTAIFGVYQTCMIVVLRKAIERQRIGERIDD